MIQTTNIRRILDRVMRHPMMKDMPFESAVEHTVDFIQLMGTPAIYDEKTAIIEVNDWRGQLPCDFEHMNQVRVAPCQHAKRFIVEQTVYPEGHEHDHTHSDENHDNLHKIIDKETVVRFSGGFLPGAVYRYSGHSFHLSPAHVPADAGELTYKLQGMVIFTSTKDVDVEISYQAFATDEEGYPLLPDNASFLRGLETYLKLKWFTVLYEMGKVSENVMQSIKQEYAWAAGDAQSEFSRLSLDEAETLFNSFKTMLPRNNEHWKAFFTNGAKEIWKRH